MAQKHIKRKKGGPNMKIRAKIPVVVFREGKTFVIYTPTLDLSSCGSSIADAQRRFGRAVEGFIEELHEMGTTDEVLTGLGWHKGGHPRKTWIPPHILKRTQMEVSIPA